MNFRIWAKTLAGGVALGLTVLALTPAQAQQASSRGMAGNMDLFRLEQQIKQLQAKINARDICARKGRIYAPTDAAADEDGCVFGGLALGQTLPLAPACESVSFAKGSLAIMDDSRLGIVYSTEVKSCGSSVSGALFGRITTCRRFYDGKAFSPCHCTTLRCPTPPDRGANVYGN